MTQQQASSCCSGQKTAIVYEYIDPVCGMQVLKRRSIILIIRIFVIYSVQQVANRNSAQNLKII